MSPQAHLRERSRPAAVGDLRTRILEPLPVRDRLLTLAGIRTALLDGGHGRPIILLHGQGEFAAVWTRVIPDLVSRYHMIAPDLPGHGASNLPEKTLDRRRIYSWLEELIESTCEEPPILVGHLLGGAIAARFARVQRNRIRQLVLVDSMGLSWFRPSAKFALPMLRFMARPTPQSQDRLFRRCMVDLDGLRTEMDGRMQLLEAYALEKARGPNVMKALGALMPRLGVPPIRPADLEQIEVPTTLIWGRYDLQVRLRVAERASERFGWPLHVIEDAADDPAVEQPDDFMQALWTALEAS